MSRRLSSLGLLVLPTMLAACAATAPAGPQRCDPVAHQALVGRNIGAVTLPAELRQRIISPGDLVTGDPDPARLNIFVDPKGWIARISCG
ncbi:I78 family peptidase inhibitor [Paracoccus salsus]|uniref:I78 family peptidase inhibitor n=1 Tax=Paracoccus salsus TaxID=2911061 RepID=UPI001EEE9147|nr:I78 family peptidase inhibitor [Paracoccus salsus]MCF3973442.1 hypothetical protein [Paracoccus salsus]